MFESKRVGTVPPQRLAQGTLARDHFNGLFQRAATRARCSGFRPTMSPKWLPSFNEEHETGRPMSIASSASLSPKKPKKKSATAPNSAMVSTTSLFSAPLTSRSSERSSGSSRKRLSLFSRNQVEETSASSQDLFSSTSAATETPASNRFSAVFQRPETASSHESRKPSGFDSWRSSVFSRKNSTVSGTTPRLTNEPVLRWLKGDGAASRPSTSYDDDRFFDSEDAFYRNHMKNTISPPFNFQHVTHTQRDHLPEINSTPQNELVSEFWAASAYQAPRSRLQGIKTEDIDLVRRLPGASRRPPPRPEPPSKSFTFRHGPLTGMTVNDSSEDLIQTLRHEDPDAITPAERASQPIQRSGLRPNGLPRQLSSRSYVSQERRSPPTMIHPALRNLDSSPAEFGPSPMGTPSTRSVQTLDYGLGLDVVPEEIEGSNSAQPSPAKPAHEHYRVAPPPPPVLNASLPPLPTQYISSSQGGQNIAQSLTDSKSSATDDARIPSLTSADSWEEDVDFCYFVEAESSCDFEWDSNSSSRNASVISQPFRDSVLTTPTRPSGTRAERGSGDSQMSTQRHVRGKSSIALNSALLFAAFDGSYDTQENVARLSGLGVNAPVPAALTPSTVFTESSGIEEISSSPTLSTEPVFSTTLNDSLDATVSQTHTSWSASKPSPQIRSELRRSKSLESLPSHPITSDAAPPALSTLPKSALIRRTSLEGPLPSHIVLAPRLPPTPPPRMALPSVPAQEIQTPLSPPLSPTSPTDPWMMRRPQTPGDRAAMQNAGRMVQRGRGRSETPSRLSHVQAVDGKEDLRQLRLFPTPPMSPPQVFPEWI